MRALVQRVRRASVAVDGRTVSSVGPGLLVLVGVERGDTETDAAWLAGKVARLRIFDDATGTMNLDVCGAGGEVLVVSQFTLCASTRRGNRPSYVRAAPGEESKPLYERFAALVGEATGRTPAMGVFGADMQVELVNDGPVTLWLDSRERDTKD